MMLDDEPLSIKNVTFDFPRVTFAWKFVFTLFLLFCLPFFVLYVWLTAKIFGSESEALSVDG